MFRVGYYCIPAELFDHLKRDEWERGRF